MTDYLKLVDEALAKAGDHSASAASPSKSEATLNSFNSYFFGPPVDTEGRPFKKKKHNKINDNGIIAGSDGTQGEAADEEQRWPKKYELNELSPPAALEELIDNLPTGVSNQRWVQAIIDADDFLAAWGEQAEALGWTADDLFRLHLFAPLRRCDAMGLIWLLQGRPVVALTEHTAAIKTASGGELTFYRKDAEFPWKRRSRTEQI